MSHLAETASLNVRHTQQRRVAALLDEIAARRQRLYVLKAYGVRRAGMRTLKAELSEVRDELAEVTNAATRPQVQPSEPAHAGPIARSSQPVDFTLTDRRDTRLRGQARHARTG